MTLLIVKRNVSNLIPPSSDGKILPDFDPALHDRCAEFLSRVNVGFFLFKNFFKSGSSGS